MINFYKFSPDYFKTDMSGNIVKTYVIFIDNDDIVRFGYVSEKFGKFYIFSNGGYYYPTEETLWCEINTSEV